MALKPLLVVGSDGFIGSNLVPLLSARGHACASIPGPACGDGIDLTENGALRRKLDGVDFGAVICLAGHSDRPFSVSNFVRTFDVNVMGFVNLLAVVADRRPEKIVFLGSYKQYGNSPSPFRETMATRPNSAYALSKDICERALDLFSRNTGVAYVSLRLSTLYGPMQNDAGLLIPETIKKCLSGGEIELTGGRQRREVTYIQDVCDAIALAVEIPDARGVMNVGAQQMYSVREIVELIHALTKSTATLRFGALPYRDDEVWEMFGDSSLARKTLHWEPRVELEAGLKKTIDHIVSSSNS